MCHFFATAFKVNIAHKKNANLSVCAFRSLLHKIWKEFGMAHWAGICMLSSPQKKQPSALSHLKGPEGPRLRFSFTP